MENSSDLLEGSLISHQSEELFEEIYKKTKKRLETASNLILSKGESLWMLDQLCQFELGRFVLQNKGLNGYWTSYVILYNLHNKLSSYFEEWMVRKSPLSIATRERFWIFQKEIEKRISSGMIIASAPCGMMDDLLLVEKKNHKNIRFVGIDLDEQSLAWAKKNAQEHGLEEDCEFLKRDAWNLEIYEQYDLITSNGLNVYEPDENRVKELYRNFYQALRPKGIFITSFFTHPPSLDKNSPWRNYNKEDAKKQSACFVDVVQVNWQSFLTEAQMRNHLEESGFKVLEIIYDNQAMFPTVVSERID